MDQYTVYLDPISGAIYRDGVRNSKFVIDKTLTGLGFSGSQSIDGGFTGDWMNLIEYA